MKRLLVQLLILTFLSVFAAAQANKKVSLLVSNCDETETICDTQHLYKYKFENGGFVGKELVVSTQTLDVRFDSGRGIVYQNRYVVTSWGDVVDLRERKIIHRSEGELFRIEGSKVFSEVSRGKKEGLFVFDLETGKYGLYRQTDIHMYLSALSPNGIRSGEWSCPVDAECRIEIRELGNKIVRVVNGDFSVERKAGSCEMTQVPVFWIDDERFLTQKNNGEILIGDIKGNVKPLLKIKIKELPYGNPKFYRDARGQIVYSCVSEYVIDVAKKSYKAYNPLGEDFSAKGDEYFYKGKSIGEVFDGASISTKDFLAVTYGKKGRFLGYHDGVKVWNSIKKEWTTIEIKWIPELIGWMEE